MNSFEACLIENQSPNDVLNSEEDQFVCCVCLDLLYKPIVLNCGHVSCFWCVHKSMNSRHDSHCPVCRNSYSHFPGICQMLHFLLLKLYPVEYKQREGQIMEEEKVYGYFSPDFNSHGDELHANGELNCIRCPAYSSAVCSESSSRSDLHSISKDKLCETAQQVESYDDNTIHTAKNPEGRQEQVSVTDLLCAACKQLLFRPVVLNCGHVYCQTCISADQRLRCEVCLCLHPKDSPKVCLLLDWFLAAKFPKEYALRRDDVQIKQVSSKQERTGTCSLEAGKQNPSSLQLTSHAGVGCDACGMKPIVGDRYKCKDCTEKIGFDLCEDCYNTRPKLQGRFNQRHTPEHKFECIKHGSVRTLRLMTGQLENGTTSVFFSDDVLWDRWEVAELHLDLAEYDDDGDDDDHDMLMVS